MIFHLEVNGTLKKCQLHNSDDERLLIMAFNIVMQNVSDPGGHAAAIELQRGIARLIVSSGAITVMGDSLEV